MIYLVSQVPRGSPSVQTHRQRASPPPDLSITRCQHLAPAPAGCWCSTKLAERLHTNTLPFSPSFYTVESQGASQGRGGAAHSAGAKRQIMPQKVPILTFSSKGADSRHFLST